jgi:hypothetical protein
MRIAFNALLAMALVAVASTAASASAGTTERAKVKVTLELTSDNTQPAPDFFEGTVKSKRPACERVGRPVKLLYNGQVVDTGFVNASGLFAVQAPSPHPDVFAFQAKVRRSDRCKIGKSAGVFADGS